MFHVFFKFNLICIQLAKIRLFFQTNKRNVIFSRRACFFAARDEVVQSFTPPYSSYKKTELFARLRTTFSTTLSPYTGGMCRRTKGWETGASEPRLVLRQCAESPVNHPLITRSRQRNNRRIQPRHSEKTVQFSKGKSCTVRKKAVSLHPQKREPASRRPKTACALCAGKKRHTHTHKHGGT